MPKIKPAGPALDEFGVQWYIVCNQCGEAFDGIIAANGHAGSCGSDQGFDILPESEAM